MAKDVDLFAAAMADVKPLAGRKRAAPPKAVIPGRDGRGTFRSRGNGPALRSA